MNLEWIFPENNLINTQIQLHNTEDENRDRKLIEST